MFKVCICQNSPPQMFKICIRQNSPPLNYNCLQRFSASFSINSQFQQLVAFCIAFISTCFIELLIGDHLLSLTNVVALQNFRSVILVSFLLSSLESWVRGIQFRFLRSRSFCKYFSLFFCLALTDIFLHLCSRFRLWLKKKQVWIIGQIKN